MLGSFPYFGLIERVSKTLIVDAPGSVGTFAAQIAVALMECVVGRWMRPVIEMARSLIFATVNAASDAPSMSTSVLASDGR